MNERTKAEWPPLQAHIVSTETLGYKFEYPTEYLDCIEWGDHDIDAGGDGHGLTFLTEADVVRHLSAVRRATSKRLVPFARGDNGDALFCFDGEGRKDIYGINLGEHRLRVRSTGFTDFVAFINDYRSQLDLPEWVPRSGQLNQS